jgi:hypothetical protein
MKQVIRAGMVLLACAAAAGLDAQQPARGAADSPATVPSELAIALMTGFMGPSTGEPRIAVGQLPPDFPPDLLPRLDGRVLGGATMPRGSFVRHIVIIASPAAADSALGALRATLERSGWHRPEEPEMQGFVPTGMDRPMILCRDSLYIGTSVAPRPAGGSRLRLDVSQVRGETFGGPCGARRDRRFGPSRDVPVPALRAPIGASSHGQSSSGGADGRTLTTRLHTTLAPAALVAHYAAQLREGGWSMRPVLESGEAAVLAGGLTDAAGVRWQGLLSVLALDGLDERDVSFRVVRVAPEDR